MAFDWARQPAPRQKLLGHIWALVNSRVFLISVLGVTVLWCLLIGLIPQLPYDALTDTSQADLWLNSFTGRVYERISTLHEFGLTRLAWSRFTLFIALTVFLLTVLNALRSFSPVWVFPGKDWRTSILTTSRDVSTTLRALARAAALNALTLYPPRRIPGGQEDDTVVVISNQDVKRWWALLLSVSLSLLMATTLAYHAVKPHREEDIAIGQTWQLHNSQQTELSLVSITEPSSNALPSTANVQTTWKRSDPSGDVFITMTQGKPVNLRGVSVYQVGYGEALKLSVSDSMGRLQTLRLLSGSVQDSQSLTLRFGRIDEEYVVSLPEQNLVLRVVQYASLPAQDIPGRAVALQLYEADTSEFLQQQYLATSDAIVMRDLTFDVAFEHYALVKQQASYWMLLFTFGILGVLISLFLLALIDERTCWAVIRRDGDETVCGIWADDTSATWLQPMLAHIQEGDDDDG